VPEHWTIIIIWYTSFRHYINYYGVTQRNMHEYSITQSLLSLALEKADEAKASKITQINLVIGELSGIVSECVQFYFDFLSKDTIASGAGLSFKMTPTRLRCRHCQAVFSPKDHNWSCPDCDEVGIEIVSGREFYMESIEVE
jgi:hydrogenase nickel incorporation protein HypA/HybF